MNRLDALKHINDQKDFLDDRSKNGIELYRKGYATLIFETSDNTPVKDLQFKAVQKSHDFNFGCNAFMLDEFENEEKNKQFREKFPKIFNYAVAPFYWNALEPEKGKPRYDKDSKKVYRRPAPDLVLDFCKENDIRVKAHCLEYDAFAPDWLPKDPVGIKRELINHFKEVADRYADKISDWDIINEMMTWNDCEYGRISRFYREDDYISFCLREAAALPFMRKFVNESFGIWELFRFSRTPYYILLELLERDNLEFDGIGIQCHEHVPADNCTDYAFNRYNPIKVCDLLDTFARFNKPIQISEITIASYSGSELENDIQAELAENMYKLWFSQKNMDGIVYWNMVDGYSWSQNGGALDMNSGENRWGGGLLTSSLEEKPIYKVLDRLINEEWHTEGVFCVSNDTGRARFKGFKGKYDIMFEYRGKQYKKEIHLDGRFDLPIKIVID